MKENLADEDLGRKNQNQSGKSDYEANYQNGDNDTGSSGYQSQATASNSTNKQQSRYASSKSGQHANELASKNASTPAKQSYGGNQSSKDGPDAANSVKSGLGPQASSGGSQSANAIHKSDPASVVTNTSNLTNSPDPLDSDNTSRGLSTSGLEAGLVSELDISQHSSQAQFGDNGEDSSDSLNADNTHAKRNS